MQTYYTNRGPVRGDCGHKHRTPEAAGECKRRDGRACRAQGGYTDYALVAVVNGEDTEPSEQDFILYDGAANGQE
jgi:hypothetical protein